MHVHTHVHAQSPIPTARVYKFNFVYITWPARVLYHTYRIYDARAQHPSLSHSLSPSLPRAAVSSSIFIQETLFISPSLSPSHTSHCCCLRVRSVLPRRLFRKILKKYGRFIYETQRRAGDKAVGYVVAARGVERWRKKRSSAEEELDSRRFPKLWPRFFF